LFFHYGSFFEMDYNASDVICEIAYLEITFIDVTLMRVVHTKRTRLWDMYRRFAILRES